MIGFIPFPRVLVVCEIQSASSRILNSCRRVHVHGHFLRELFSYAFKDVLTLFRGSRTHMFLPWRKRPRIFLWLFKNVVECFDYFSWAFSKFLNFLTYLRVSSSLIGRHIHSALCHIEAKSFVNYYINPCWSFNGKSCLYIYITWWCLCPWGSCFTHWSDRDNCVKYETQGRRHHRAIWSDKAQFFSEQQSCPYNMDAPYGHRLSAWRKSLTTIA